ncbi:MAG: hypothetical protein RLZZ546_2463 [Bacteroidota bacterium]|jgi:glycerol-3-phosphate dehydrogenase
MKDFSINDRYDKLKKCSDDMYDLIVIGGGVTGCGIALDAASRGLKTILLEKEDFASGTSSKSTKLIHGGLRYLKQFEIGLVRETGMERAIVHHLAPHLVHPEKMLLPIIDKGTFNKWSASLAISVYDFLAKVPKEERKKSYTQSETLLIEPLLDVSKVKSSIVYSEYRTDDARLTIEIIKKSIELGATAFNYCEVADLIYENEKITGVSCKDHIFGNTINFFGRLIISAAGPWVDDIRIKDQSKKGKTLRLTKGVHIVVDHNRLPLNHAVYFDDFKGRMIFAIPRGMVTYIGTSDTDYKGDKDNVICTKEDAAYLLEATNGMFPDINLSLHDLKSSWAGLRPLIQEEGKSPSEVSRKDEIFISESGLISIAGGKLTGYRKMAKRVVNLSMKLLNKGLVKCKTRKIQLTSDAFSNHKEVNTYIKNLTEKLNKNLAWYLVTTYGKQSKLIIDHSVNFKDIENERIKILMSELWYTIHHECCSNPLDFYNRRTGIIYFDIDLIELSIDTIITQFQKTFNWNEEQKTMWYNRTKEMVRQAQIRE